MKIKTTFKLYIALIIMNLLSFYSNVYNICNNGFDTLRLFNIELNLFAIFFVIFIFQKIAHNEEMYQLGQNFSAQMNSVLQTANTLADIAIEQKVKIDKSKKQEDEVTPELERPKTLSAVQFINIEGEEK